MTWHKLGDICEFKYGSSLPASARSGDAFPVYGSNGVVGAHLQSLTDGPTIVVGRKGSIGEVNFSSSPCWPIDTTYFIDRTATKADLRWLSYALSGLRLGELNKATGVPGLNRNDAYEKLIYVPALEEQKRIAAILDQADELRRKRQRALDRLNQLGQAIFFEMFGSIDEAGAVPFEEVVFFQEGPGVRNWQFRDEGVKLINVKNIVDGYLDVSNTNRYLDPLEAYGKYKHFLLEEGDYVLASSGVTWGKIAEVKSSDLPLCLNTSMIRLRPVGESLTKSYLRGFVELGSFRTQIDRIITGSAQPNFGPSHLKQIKIPVPEIAEQMRFAERISELRQCANQNANQCKGFERLFASLQHRAFRGGLTASSLKEAAE